jgi:hypothetical protein
LLARRRTRAQLFWSGEGRSNNCDLSQEATRGLPQLLVGAIGQPSDGQFIGVDGKPSDRLRQCARCTRCGHRGATLQHLGWAGTHIGFQPFPRGGRVVIGRGTLRLQKCGLANFSAGLNVTTFISSPPRQHESPPHADKSRAVATRYYGSAAFTFARNTLSC